MVIVAPLVSSVMIEKFESVVLAVIDLPLSRVIFTKYLLQELSFIHLAFIAIFLFVLKSSDFWAKALAILGTRGLVFMVTTLRMVPSVAITE